MNIYCQKRIVWNAGVAATTVLAFSASPALARQDFEKKPNIVIIYTDDLGAGDLSCLNDGWVKTPNLDRMAAEGLLIKNYYTAAPVSSPSRTGLTTGIFPLECGINTYLHSRKGNTKWNQCDYVDPSLPTMAKMLKTAGYTTGHFGKWHMGGGRDVKDAPSIAEYGFDEYVSTYESPEPDPRITATNWIWSDDDEVKRWDRTAFFIDQTLDFLSRNKDVPCFVNLWPDDVHTPWVPDAETAADKHGWETRPNFVPVMEEYDRQIGRFFDRLKELGLDENTIVIFTSDNGPAPSFRQIRTNGMRGTKCSLYEGGINMPFIIRWPGYIKAGQVDEQSVICAVDILPSMASALGVEIAEGQHISGEDMSAVLWDKPVARKKDIMWEFGLSAEYASDGNRNKSPHLAIRRGDMKLLINHDDHTAELYDLSTDRNETRDLAAEYPELVKELSAIVLEWWERRPDPNSRKGN